MKERNVENMISAVHPGSIAARMGVLPGDRLLSINGQPVADVIDYRFLTADESLEVSLIKQDGSEWILEIEKDFDEELGIEFENPVMAETKQCRNKCVFCFIDQMPPGLRPGLYIKDDDSRLSFLQGNYITLTNMHADELDKLIKYHISPLNVSVHTTNPELRRRMLNNRFAGEILNTLERFHQNRLEMNLQIVLCPGWNDEKELDRTLEDLEKIGESIISIAVVPIGLTKYQKNQALRPVDSEKAKEVIHQLEKWQKRWSDKFNRKLVYPSDEFYVKAGWKWPRADAYEAFFQLENGVGMMASFEEDLLSYLKKMPRIRKKKPFLLTLVTGEAAFPFMQEMAGHVMEKIEGLSIQVLSIKNDFWGDQITVSGLVTGRDLISQLEDRELGNLVMLPANMMKSDEALFLDDLTLDQISHALDAPVQSVKTDGREWIRSILRNTNDKLTGRSEFQYGKTNCGCHRASKCGKIHVF